MKGRAPQIPSAARKENARPSTTFSAVLYNMDKQKQWVPITDTFVTIVLEWKDGDTKRPTKLYFLRGPEKVHMSNVGKVENVKSKETFVRWLYEETIYGARFKTNAAGEKFSEAIFVEASEKNLQNNSDFKLLEIKHGGELIAYKAQPLSNVSDVLEKICDTKKLHDIKSVLKYQDLDEVIDPDALVDSLRSTKLKVIETELPKNNTANFATQKSIKNTDVTLNIGDPLWQVLLELANLNVGEVNTPRVANVIETFVSEHGGISYLRQVNDLKMSPQLADELNTLAGQVHALNQRSHHPSGMTTLERKKRKAPKPPSPPATAAPAPPEMRRTQSQALPPAPVTEMKRSQSQDSNLSKPINKRKAPTPPVAKPPPTFIPPPPPDEPPPLDKSASPVGPLSPKSMELVCEEAEDENGAREEEEMEVGEELKKTAVIEIGDELENRDAAFVQEIEINEQHQEEVITSDDGKQNTGVEERNTNVNSQVEEVPAEQIPSVEIIPTDDEHLSFCENENEPSTDAVITSETNATNPLENNDLDKVESEEEEFSFVTNETSPTMMRLVEDEKEKPGQQEKKPVETRLEEKENIIIGPPSQADQQPDEQTASLDNSPDEQTTSLDNSPDEQMTTLDNSPVDQVTSLDNFPVDQVTSLDNSPVDPAPTISKEVKIENETNTNFELKGSDVILSDKASIVAEHVDKSNEIVDEGTSGLHPKSSVEAHEQEDKFKAKEIALKENPSLDQESSDVGIDMTDTVHRIDPPPPPRPTQVEHLNQPAPDDCSVVEPSLVQPSLERSEKERQSGKTAKKPPSGLYARLKARTAELSAKPTATPQDTVSMKSTPAEVSPPRVVSKPLGDSSKSTASTAEESPRVDSKTLWETPLPITKNPETSRSIMKEEENSLLHKPAKIPAVSFPAISAQKNLYKVDTSSKQSGSFQLSNKNISVQPIKKETTQQFPNTLPKPSKPPPPQVKPKPQRQASLSKTKTPQITQTTTFGREVSEIPGSRETIETKRVGSLKFGFAKDINPSASRAVNDCIRTEEGVKPSQLFSASLPPPPSQPPPQPPNLTQQQQQQQSYPVTNAIYQNKDFVDLRATNL